MRVNGQFMKSICIINLTVLMGLRDQILNGVCLFHPGVFSSTYACIWKIYHEHTGYDPKDGELCLIRSKSGETLMEDRSSSDVQIDCQNWAQGRKTNRTIQQLVPSEVSLRIAGAQKSCIANSYLVKRMIRGLRNEMFLTYSQTLNGYVSQHT